MFTYSKAKRLPTINDSKRLDLQKRKTNLKPGTKPTYMYHTPLEVYRNESQTYIHVPHTVRGLQKRKSNLHTCTTHRQRFTETNVKPTYKYHTTLEVYRNERQTYIQVPHTVRGLQKRKSNLHTCTTQRQRFEETNVKPTYKYQTTLEV